VRTEEGYTETISSFGLLVFWFIVNVLGFIIGFENFQLSFKLLKQWREDGIKDCETEEELLASSLLFITMAAIA